MELANLFSELAFEQIGQLADKELRKAIKDANEAIKNGDEQAYQEAVERQKLWENGGTNKILLHALVGGIVSRIGGNDAAMGALAGGVNEALQGELSKLKDNPAMWEWASAIIGGAIGELAGKKAQTGAAIAVSGTKNNELKDLILHPITTGEGMIDGLKSQGIETIEGLEGIIGHPVDTVVGIKEVLLEIKNNPELLAEIGVDIVEDIQGRIDKIADGTAYETGYELGRLTVEIAGTAAGAKFLSKIPGLGKLMEAIGSKGASKNINDILKNATPGRVTKGKAIQWEKFGGYNQALNDFKSMDVQNVRDIPGGKVGTLPDGRTVNVRIKSSDGRPTLELYDGKNSIKIRYNS